MSNTFHTVKVQQIIQETPDATSVFFEIPVDLKQEFSFQAGQYLTLGFNLEGKTYRRAYSICTSPEENALAVTVKRVANGKISNHINDKLKVGDRVEVMAPIGKFTTPISPTNATDYYLFAAGSGITPMMSIIKTVLKKEPQSRCHLLYGNRNEESIIFHKTLTNLANTPSNQLNIRHILSQPKMIKAGGLAGLFGKKKITWTGWTGYLNKQKINTFLENHPAKGNQAKYFICGPSVMMDLVTSSLKALAIPEKEIMVEYFASPKKEVKSTPEKGYSETSTVKVTLNGADHTLEINDETTILDALINKGVDPPFSCSSGACSTCMAKVIKGTVAMDECFALDETEKKAGLVLTCQSHPTTEEVELSFDYE